MQCITARASAEKFPGGGQQKIRPKNSKKDRKIALLRGANGKKDRKIAKNTEK